MSVAFRAGEAAAWCGGRLRQGDPEATLRGVSIDTRTLRGGELFVAIRGERHDAHGFLSQALAAGVAGLLVERDAALPADVAAGLPVIEAGDTTRALGALAAGHRAGFTGPLVAITGSNGKTSTKEMCAAILAAAGPCLKSRGNWNNQFGLPLALLEREPEHRFVVVEIGMNHRGEIAPLAAIARPSVGVITNVGTAHIEHLGSAEAIAEEKGELVAALDADGVAVLNADDPRVRALATRTRARVVGFGLGRGADFRAESVRAEGAGYRFRLVTPDASAEVFVPGLGEFTVSNALAAAAAARAAGVRLEHVVAGLARHRPAPGRLERVALPNGAVLIDDTYNANPQSLEAALRALAGRKGSARGLVVLGDMGELGEAAAEAHRAAGRLVAELGLDELLVLGERARDVAQGATQAGLDATRVHESRDQEEAARELRKRLRPGDWVLVKGSRAARMERVVAALRARESD